MGHPRYFIVFRKGASAAQIDKTKAGILNTGGKVMQEFGRVLNGFAAEIEPSYLQQLEHSLLEDGTAIDYIEKDGVVTVQ